jgi:hypothetical protein
LIRADTWIPSETGTVSDQDRSLPPADAVCLAGGGREGENNEPPDEKVDPVRVK